jgi:hypothetical protein
LISSSNNGRRPTAYLSSLFAVNREAAVERGKRLMLQEAVALMEAGLLLLLIVQWLRSDGGLLLLLIVQWLRFIWSFTSLFQSRRGAVASERSLLHCRCCKGTVAVASERSLLHCCCERTVTVALSLLMIV